VNLLLDTHVALWAITDDRRLTPNARALISDGANSVSVSTASLWEIAIKFALQRKGANRMPISAAAALQFFESSGYDILAITSQHVRTLETLAPLHADPFDRLLVAQALSEPLRLVTHDPEVAQYSDAIIAV
jgi:PIN domain nuclease of toxin-antitoxin system